MMSAKTTRRDCIVIIGCCLFLLACLGATGKRGRQLAFRMTCRANLNAMGKAMAVYAGDFEGEYPRAGGRANAWVHELPNWIAVNRYQAYGLTVSGIEGKTTLTSNLYLLIKYAELTPKFFVCKGEPNAREFRLDEAAAPLPAYAELIDLWDFGPTTADSNPDQHCSYAYHFPFGGVYALTTKNDPNMAVAADRSPWMTGSSSEGSDRWQAFVPELTSGQGSPETAIQGNSLAHQQDGQNVLFVDGSVRFERRSYDDRGNDNIYTYRPAMTDHLAEILRKKGAALPSPYGVSNQSGPMPGDRHDAWLVNGNPEMYPRSTGPIR